MLEIGAVPDSGNPFITEAMIRRQLAKMLGADQMKSAGVLTRFLRFVVEETLLGRKHAIKEYTIGIHVFKRAASFTPQTDAVVRINAGRLRRMLTQYYTGPGYADEIRIDIPKGRYVPIFALSAETHPLPPSQNMRGLTVAVLPFTIHDFNGDHVEFAETLEEELCGLLHKTQELSVAAFSMSRRFSDPQADLSALGKLLNASYLITGNVLYKGDTLHVGVQLLYSDDATTVWSGSFDRNLAGTTLRGARTAIISSISTTLGSLCGAFIPHLAQLSPFNRSYVLRKHEAFYWLYLAKQIYTPQAMTVAHAAVRTLAIEEPFNSFSWAALAHLHIDGALMRIPEFIDSLDTGVDLARKALDINPRDQHGYMALAFGHIFARERQECLLVVDRALSIGPCSLGLRGFAAINLVCAGAYDRADIHIQTTVSSGVPHSWLFDIACAVYYYHRKEYDAVLERSSTIADDPNHLGMLLRLAALGRLRAPGDEPVPSLPPGFENENITETLTSFLLDEKIVLDILSGIRAGQQTKKNTHDTEHTLH